MGVVAPIINMSSIVYLENLYLLIPRIDPTMRVVMNLNEDGLNNGDSWALLMSSPT